MSTPYLSRLRLIKDDKTRREGGWTFLSNHTHVLACLYADSTMLLREVAEIVGITERAVQKIVAELEQGGVLTKWKDGRRNRYRVNTQAPLRHPVESHCTVGDLLRFIVGG
jgi:DNA-binding MarR family transcriptional regulator